MRFSSVGLGGNGCLLCHSEFILVESFLVLPTNPAAAGG